MTSSTHLVLIPSYNTGPRLLSTVAEVLRYWAPVWIVVDGSTDGSERAVEALAATDARIKVLRLPRNRGKGAAVAAGVGAALKAGFTHALAMDSDGQHPADLIGQFMALSEQNPAAMVLGRPIFGPEAPMARRQGRKLSVAMVRVEILGAGIDDPLFGFRVYPLAPLQQAFLDTLWARGFDFDQEVIVRMFWAGVPALNVPAPCRYLSKADGGVSHFNYLRDNVLLVWLQIRLLGELLWRWPWVMKLRRARRGAAILAMGLLPWWALHSAAAAPLAVPDPLIAPGDPSWEPLLAQLALVHNRQSHFEERRYFPFRTGPVILSGTVRISPREGLSLEYQSPDPRIMIIDGEGLLMRDAKGRDRSVPNDPHLAQSLGAFVSILRFDPVQIRRQYVLHGSRAGDNWRLSLIPQGTDWSAIVLTGQGDTLSAIELIRTTNQRITIALSGSQDGVEFSPADRSRYFRR